MSGESLVRPFPLLRRNDGSLVPSGRVHRTLVEPFINASSLPSWLAVDAGSATYGAMATTRGYLQVTAGTTVNDLARVKTAFTFDTADYREIRFTVEGLQLSGGTATVTFGLQGTDCGAAFEDVAGSAIDVQLKVRHVGGPTTVLDNDFYRLRGTNGNGVRNLTFMVRPAEGFVYLLEDDQVMIAHDTSALWTDGLVDARFQLQTKTAGTGENFQVSQVKLDLIHN